VTEPKRQTICKNRRARFNYTIEETLEQRKNRARSNFKRTIAKELEELSTSDPNTGHA
jgi:hypothetical protein